jgi:hypothetical protein
MATTVRNIMLASPPSGNLGTQYSALSDNEFLRQHENSLVYFYWDLFYFCELLLVQVEVMAATAQ